MTAFQWWRSWHGAPTDHKWSVIAMRSGVKVGIVSAIAWALFDYASQHKERGTVDGFDTEMYAVYSGFDETEIVAVIKAMTDKGIIIDGMLTNWMKRQPQREDDSNERVRKWRDMKRKVTQGNAKISTDKDKDKESEKEKNPPPDGEQKTEIQMLEHLEVVFSNARGTTLPDWTNPKATQKTWRTPIRTILNQYCKGDAELAEHMIITTVHKMMSDGLTFSTPVQILKTFESLVLDKHGTSSALEGYTYVGK